MMRTKTKNGSPSSPNVANGEAAVGSWELRPGGMLVQKREAGNDRAVAASAPIIRVKVKYGSSLHEVRVSCQATFGELKKLLSAETGLHPEDQKLFFKDKEKDSNAYLDIVGVKDKSKLVLVEDPQSHERRLLEMRRNSKMEKASKSISEISLEVDKLATQVKALETVISRGERVAEKEALGLTESLMNQLIKLDAITADGDAKIQRRMQVKRVQKYVETLDMLKVKNAAITIKQQGPTRQQGPPKQPVVVTTKWETFDTTPVPPPPASSSKLNWEFFD